MPRKPTLNRIQKAVLKNFTRLNVYTLLVKKSSNGRYYRVPIKASKYKQALDIACSRYRGKWINYSTAKKMDLISARVDAAKLSRTAKNHEAFVILRKDEFVVETSYGKNDDVYAKYRNGGEDKEFLDSLKPTTKVPTPTTNDKPVKTTRASIDKKPVVKVTSSKTIKNMTTTKEKSSKKATKKVVPTKNATAKKGQPVKRARFEDSKKVTMTNKEMTKKIKQGYSYYTPTGVNKTKYIPERPNQDLVNENYREVAPQK